MTTYTPPREAVAATAARIQNACRSILEVHKGVMRVGRIFRDVWQPEILAALAVGPANWTPAQLNWRGDGRSIGEWATLGFSLWRLHSLMNDTPPASAQLDPSKTAGDVAVLTTMWCEKGNVTPTNPLNADTLTICSGLSYLCFEVAQVVQEYDVRMAPWLDALRAGGADIDPYTERPLSAWSDARAALGDYNEVCFGGTSKASYGVHPALLRF